MIPGAMHSDYLETRRPTHQLRARTTVLAPLDAVFEFFSRPGNLGLLTPSNMGFAITDISGPMEEGTLISYRLRVGGVPLKWTTRIDAWEPGGRFVDAQIAGPYACWWHEHRFEADGADRTIMADRVLYAPPLGILGRAANQLFIKNSLRAIFSFRSDAIRLRFGEPTMAGATTVAS